MPNFIAQNLLSIKCLLRSLNLCFIDFGSSAIGLGIIEVEVAHTIKALLVHFWLNSENGMYRTTLFVVGHVPFGFV